MTKEATLEAIDVTALDTVCGGTTPGEDAKNMVKGAIQGARIGGPFGAIAGTIAGSVPGFVDAGKQIVSERKRGADLDRQREEMKKKHPEWFR